MMRFNHLHPPFNNREAAPGGAGGGRPEGLHARDRWRPEAGGECVVFHLRHPARARGAGGATARNLEKAKALLQESGYNGEKIVLMTADRPPDRAPQALVTSELLRRLGINVDYRRPTGAR